MDLLLRTANSPGIWIRTAPLAACGLLVAACGSGGSGGPSDSGGPQEAAATDGSPSAEATPDSGSATPEGGVVFPLQPVTARRIAAGYYVSCAASASGVVCWGAAPGSQPASHTALSGSFRQLAAGPSSPDNTICALATDGSAHCADWTGGMGLTTTSIASCLPAGSFVDIAVDGASVAYAGLVAPGGAVKVIAPTTCGAAAAPSGLEAAKRISIRSGHVCTLSGAGAPSCWVASTQGAVQSESVVSDTYVDIAAGAAAACAATAPGSVRCWDNQGAEDTSSLDFAKTASAHRPVVQLMSSSASDNLCALFNDGTVACSTQFAAGPPVSVDFGGGATVVEIAVGSTHVCGIRPDDSVVCQPLSCSNCTAMIAPPAGFVAAPR